MSSHHDNCSTCERLHAINPKSYPKMRELSEEEKAANRRWVTEQRAKRSGK